MTQVPVNGIVWCKNNKSSLSVQAQMFKQLTAVFRHLM